jgi:hypothetical protein
VRTRGRGPAAHDGLEGGDPVANLTEQILMEQLRFAEARERSWQDRVRELQQAQRPQEEIAAAAERAARARAKKLQLQRELRKILS